MPVKKHWVVDRPGLSLEEWNRSKAKLHEEQKEQFRSPELFANGLVCDNCDGELYDMNQADPLGHPGMVRVKCKGCGMRDWRYE